MVRLGLVLLYLDDGGRRANSIVLGSQCNANKLSLSTTRSISSDMESPAAPRIFDFFRTISPTQVFDFGGRLAEWSCWTICHPIGRRS